MFSGDQYVRVSFLITYTHRCVSFCMEPSALDSERHLDDECSANKPKNITETSVCDRQDADIKALKPYR
jgi:hypothetical protein